MLWDAAVAVILIVWFVATVFNQFPAARWSPFARLDIAGLVPLWTFFAPNPGRHDVHLVYAELDQDAVPMTGWMPLHRASFDERIRWLWNPHRFARKGITDSVASLAETSRELGSDEKALQLSLSYLSLLAYVTQQAPVSTGTHRQFAIVRTQGFGDSRAMEITFVSAIHRV